MKKEQRNKLLKDHLRIKIFKGYNVEIKKTEKRETMYYIVPWELT